MATEIELKFLVRDDSWRGQVREQFSIRQGYLANTERGSIRVRISGNTATLNIKSMTIGATRTEFEYTVPVVDAVYILENLCLQPVIDKTRYLVSLDGHTWEVDEFAGQNAGLIVAEIELDSPDARYTRPDWLGEEVTHDPRYYNVNLLEHPYNEW